MLRAIRMCLRPTVDNRNNTTRLLESLGCASGSNFTSGIIPQMYHASETSVIPYFHMQLYFNILIIFQDSYLVLYYGNEFITAQMHLLTSR